MTRFFRWAVALATALLTAASAPAQEFRTMTDMEGREVTFKADPRRIVTIDRGYLPQALRALGRDDRLVATGGVYPRSGPYDRNKTDTMFLVPRTIEIPNIGWAGYGAYDLEKLVEVRPDLIIINQLPYTRGNSNQESLIRRIQDDLNIPVFIVHSAPGDQESAKDVGIYLEPIRLLGRIVGAPERAEEVIAAIQSRLDRIAGFKRESPDRTMILGLTDPEKGVGYVYGEDYSYAMYSSSLAGVNNVYKEFANPIFSAEQIIELNPDSIVLVDAPAPDESLSRFAESPLMRSISAVRSGRIHSSGQLFWWGDAKLMLPVQLMVYAKAHYQLDDADIRRFHADYLADLFGIEEEEAARLLKIQNLGHLLESE